ncbi:aerotolerance operon [Leptospira ellinghausenii]|uniref:Aerotolerance operon n=1 Tax=Leptospira ellinghausenii TaxID=1917822 RepID=A0A2P2D8D6_9LEPT|nr:aerotolerance operon [Leptospira ellinghausenii]
MPVKLQFATIKLVLPEIAPFVARTVAVPALDVAVTRPVEADIVAWLIPDEIDHVT